jgi:hypothetical protein
MKLAPWFAGAALGIVVLTLSTAKAVDPPQRLSVFDVSGIDTLEVKSNRGVAIRIRSDLPASAKYEDSTESHVLTHRQGSRLVIDAQLDGYQDLELSVPSSVHRFVLRDGAVTTKENLPEVELLASDGVTWTGNVGRLVMRDVRIRSRPGACDCNGATNMTVASGTIAEALFFSPNGSLKLESPDDIGAVHAWLGPKGAISLDDARRFDQIHVVETEAEMPDPGLRRLAPP